MNSIKIEKKLAFLTAVGCLALASGCSSDDGSDVQPAAVAKAEDAQVRVLHLSPDAPGVDVFVNGGSAPAVTNLGFPSGTPYLAVPAGAYTFDVAATGATAADAVLSIEGLKLAEGTSYTAVAFDELSSIAALALEDDYKNLGAGKIRIRAVHAASAVGQVDIWNVTDAASPSPLYENVDFGVAGGALDVPAGAYKLGIDVNDDKTPDVTFALPSLPAGTFANVFATNDKAGAVFLVAQLRDGSTVRIDPQ